MGNNMVYIDGTMHRGDRAMISVYDHGLLYGDGVFEGIRIYGGRVFKLTEHIERLYDSAKAIRLTIPLERHEMIRAVEETVSANRRGEGYIRLMVTRGPGDLGLNPDNCRRATIIIIVDDIALYPKEFYEKGIAIITASTRRTPADSLDPRIKSLNYLNNIMAKMEAQRAGCMEAVMLNHEGAVAECTGDNIFIVTKGRLETPHPSQGLLKGITRETVIELAEASGIPVLEAVLTPFDLHSADECFLTGSGAELMPVTAIDGRVIGNGSPGPITADLARAFRRYIYDTSDKAAAG